MIAPTARRLYIDRHPDLAGEIRELFLAMAEMELAREGNLQAAPEGEAPTAPALKQADIEKPRISRGFCISRDTSCP